MAPDSLTSGKITTVGPVRGTGDSARAAELELAFVELLAAHGGRLRRIAASYARGAEREDLLQEILCQIWRSLPSFRGDAAIGTWVYRVALNTALSYGRRKNRRPREAPTDAAAPEPVAPPGAWGREDAILEEFLGSLGEIDRSLLILYLEGLSYAQMAEVTGLSAGVVGVRLHRIKRAYSIRYLEGEP